MKIKRRVEELALLGGQSLFKKILHVGAPNIGNRRDFLRRVNDILDRRWLTNDGPYLKEFEKSICERLDVKHCVAMCNGTVALEIAIRALGLKGDVIVPSLTFVATAHALRWQGISPVFCDVDPKTYTLDPEQVLQRITPRTTGIIGVHLWGQICDTEALERIAHDHHIQLMFDASHAFGCTQRGGFVGRFGEAEVFSFHATKSVNSLEGGAVVTNNGALAQKIRLMRNFGFAGYDHVVYVGTNGKMNEVSAAMGLTSLESMSRFFRTNRDHYHAYQKALKGCPGVTLMPYNEKETCNYQYIVIEIDPVAAGLSRDQLAELLWAENVRARRYFSPGCHRMEPYLAESAETGHLLQVTETLTQRTLVLPTGTAVSPADVKAVGSLIRFAIHHASTLRSHLR